VQIGSFSEPFLPEVVFQQDDRERLAHFRLRQHVNLVLALINLRSPCDLSEPYLQELNLNAAMRVFQLNPAELLVL